MDGFLDTAMTSMASPLETVGVPHGWSKDVSIGVLLAGAFFLGYIVGKG